MNVPAAKGLGSTRYYWLIEYPTILAGIETTVYLLEPKSLLDGAPREKDVDWTPVAADAWKFHSCLGAQDVIGKLRQYFPRSMAKEAEHAFVIPYDPRA